MIQHSINISLIKSCTKHQNLGCTLKWQRHLKKKHHILIKNAWMFYLADNPGWSVNRNLAKSLGIRIHGVSIYRDQRRKQLLKKCLSASCWALSLQLHICSVSYSMVVGLQTGPCTQKARRHWKKRQVFPEQMAGLTSKRTYTGGLSWTAAR